MCLRRPATLLLLAISLPIRNPAAIVTFNDDGAWNWFQDERAIVVSGVRGANPTLLIGSVAAGVHDPARKGNVEVVSYDFASGKIVRSALHQPATETDRTRWLNDHNAPALIARPDGRLLAMYTLHGQEDKLYHRVSLKPADASTWGEEQTFVPRPGSRVVFPNLQLLAAENGGEGRLYAFFRGLGGRLMPSWTYSDDGGVAWSPGGLVLDLPAASKIVPYAKYASDGAATVHIAYTGGHHFDYGNALYHVYLRGGTLFRSDGSSIRDLKQGLRGLDEGTRIFQADSQSVAWLSDTQVDSPGNPYIAYSVQPESAKLPLQSRGGDHRYRYARWDGARWLDYPLAFAGSRIHTYADGDDCTGLVALDPQDPNVVYISTNADPVTAKPVISATDRQRHWEIYQGVTRNGGQSWTWKPITQDSKADNIRPVVPVWKSTQVAVIWMRGTMKTYTDYNFEIVGTVGPRNAAQR